MTYAGLEKNQLDTPFLWIDLDQLETNIARLAAYFKHAGVGWRPHTKAVKVPAIAHKALAAGAHGVTCAKLGEAEVMAAAGIRDILVANQIVGPIKTARLAHLQRQADVKVLVDDEANLRELGQAAQARGVEIGVLVEVDIGMERAGVQPGAPALALARAAGSTPGVRFRGLMAWEGHAADTMDREAQRAVIEASLAQLHESLRLCREADLPVEIVSAGGSQTYWVTAHAPGITEVEAGGAMLGDVYYRDGGARAEPALFVRAGVTSRPAANRIILDAGFKTLPAFYSVPEPVGLAGVASVAPSAEHLTVTLNQSNAEVKPGDRFDFIVGYSDMTVFLYDQLIGIRNGVVEVVWPILGRGKVQ
jgi:D-serine deaminase-like pyridoxal phosphate-dependent protein